MCSMLHNVNLRTYLSSSSKIDDSLNEVRRPLICPAGDDTKYCAMFKSGQAFLFIAVILSAISLVAFIPVVFTQCSFTRLSKVVSLLTLFTCMFQSLTYDFKKKTNQLH